MAKERTNRVNSPSIMAARQAQRLRRSKCSIGTKSQLMELRSLFNPCLLFGQVVEERLGAVSDRALTVVGVQLGNVEAAVVKICTEKHRLARGSRPAAPRAQFNNNEQLLFSLDASIEQNSHRAPKLGTTARQIKSLSGSGSIQRKKAAFADVFSFDLISLNLRPV